MTLAELARAGRAPALPLSIDLADGERLQLDSLLRVLPGQRYVGRATWRGRTVLAKLLVGGKAARHFQREVQGARLLAEQGLNTPLLLAEGQHDGGAWLLFDYLDDAQSLVAAWAEQGVGDELNAPRQALLAKALSVIGQLHGRGLWQADLHLDNLLQRDGQLFLIDGGGVRVDGGVVSDKGLKLAAGSYVVQVGKRKFARVLLGE